MTDILKFRIIIIILIIIIIIIIIIINNNKTKNNNNNNNKPNADRLARTSENLNFTDSPKSQPLSFFEFDHLNVFTLECLFLNMSGKIVCDRQ